MNLSLFSTAERATDSVTAGVRPPREIIIVMISTTASSTDQSSSTHRNLNEISDTVWAEVAVHTGLGLAPGQELVMTATLDAIPLARRITEHAYKAGASLVTTLFTDEESALLRFRHGQDATFDTAASWLYEGYGPGVPTRRGAVGDRGERSFAAGERGRGKSEPDESRHVESLPAGTGVDFTARHEINWTIVACATPAWAAAVFPDLPRDEAMARLWAAIFAASRADQPDPTAAWKEHDANSYTLAPTGLNERRYSALYTSGDPVRISAWGWPTIIYGSAGAPWRKMGDTAFPICRRRKFSPRRTKIAWRDGSPAPSRCRTKAR